MTSLRRCSYQRAFTLTELIISLVIIALLALLGTSSFEAVMDTSKEKEARLTAESFDSAYRAGLTFHAASGISPSDHNDLVAETLLNTPGILNGQHTQNDPVDTKDDRVCWDDKSSKKHVCLDLSGARETKSSISVTSPDGPGDSGPTTTTTPPPWTWDAQPILGSLGSYDSAYSQPLDVNIFLNIDAVDGRIMVKNHYTEEVCTMSGGSVIECDGNPGVFPNWLDRASATSSGVPFTARVDFPYPASPNLYVFSMQQADGLMALFTKPSFGGFLNSATNRFTFVTGKFVGNQNRWEIPTDSGIAANDQVTLFFSYDGSALDDGTSLVTSWQDAFEFSSLMLRSNVPTTGFADQTP